jgi:hypothetical protein
MLGQPCMSRHWELGTALETPTPLQKRDTGFSPAIPGGHRWIHPETPEFRSRGCMKFFGVVIACYISAVIEFCMHIYIIYWSVHNFGATIHSALQSVPFCTHSNFPPFPWLKGTYLRCSYTSEVLFYCIEHWIGCI